MRVAGVDKTVCTHSCPFSIANSFGGKISPRISSVFCAYSSLRSFFCCFSGAFFPALHTTVTCNAHQHWCGKLNQRVSLWQHQLRFELNYITYHGCQQRSGAANLPVQAPLIRTDELVLLGGRVLTPWVDLCALRGGIPWRAQTSFA